jgi:hypothetical protein
MLTAAYQINDSPGAVILAILILGLLFTAWIVALFFLVLDSISLGSKIVWFLAVTCVAPLGIPAYLTARHLRHRRSVAA